MNSNFILIINFIHFDMNIDFPLKIINFKKIMP